MDNRKYERPVRRHSGESKKKAPNRLREFPTFAKFSDDDLKRLVKAAHRTSTSGPWPLIREQTPSDVCYILLSGEAGVYVGKDRIAVVGPGEIIGESALRRGKLRNATVTTAGKAEVLHIGRDDLDRLLTEISALRETMDDTVKRHVPEAATAESELTCGSELLAVGDRGAVRK